MGDSLWLKGECPDHTMCDGLICKLLLNASWFAHGVMVDLGVHMDRETPRRLVKHTSVGIWGLSREATP